MNVNRHYIDFGLQKLFDCPSFEAPVRLEADRDPDGDDAQSLEAS